MRMIPIHLAKRQSNRTKLSRAGATAMVVVIVGLAALGSAASKLRTRNWQRSITLRVIATGRTSRAW
jgi:hypothetical protein